MHNISIMLAASMIEFSCSPAVARATPSKSFAGNLSLESHAGLSGPTKIRRIPNAPPVSRYEAQFRQSEFQVAFSAVDVGQDVEIVKQGIQAILFPEAGRLRSRRIISRSRVRPTGKYPSLKLGRMVHWESVYELHAFRLLDCDSNVRTFAEQPCEIRYVLHECEHSHFPDVLVVHADRKEFWEIKPDSHAHRPDITDRTALLSTCLPDWGYRYRLVLASELTMQPRMNNIVTLLRFGRTDVPAVHRESAQEVLRRTRMVTWQQVNDGALGVNGRATLCRLTLEGLLTVEMHTQIGPTTVFRLRKEII